MAAKLDYTTLKYFSKALNLRSETFWEYLLNYLLFQNMPEPF